MPELQISDAKTQHWKNNSLTDFLRGNNIAILRLNDLKKICDAYGVQYSHYATKDQLVLAIRAQGDLEHLIQNNIKEVGRVVAKSTAEPPPADEPDRDKIHQRQRYKSMHWKKLEKVIRGWRLEPAKPQEGERAKDVLLKQVYEHLGI